MLEAYIESLNSHFRDERKWGGTRLTRYHFGVNASFAAAYEALVIDCQPTA